MIALPPQIFGLLVMWGWVTLGMRYSLNEKEYHRFKDFERNFM
jgi:hypothetical protein